MTNGAIAKMLVLLRDEQQRLRAEVARLSAELDQVDQAVSAVEDIIDRGRDENDGPEQSLARRLRGRRSVKDVVLLVLSETPGRRWTRRDLVAALSGRGTDTVGYLAGSVSNALTMLSKQQQVVRAPSGEWSLVRPEDSPPSSHDDTGRAPVHPIDPTGLALNETTDGARLT